jgi:hypothetical protein
LFCAFLRGIYKIIGVLNAAFAALQIIQCAQTQLLHQGGGAIAGNFGVNSHF